MQTTKYSRDKAMVPLARAQNLLLGTAAILDSPKTDSTPFGMKLFINIYVAFCRKRDHFVVNVKQRKSGK